MTVARHSGEQGELRSTPEFLSGRAIHLTREGGLGWGEILHSQSKIPPVRRDDNSLVRNDSALTQIISESVETLILLSEQDLPIYSA